MTRTSIASRLICFCAALLTVAPTLAVAQSECDEPATLTGTAVVLDRVPTSSSVTLTFTGDGGEQTVTSDASSGDFSVALDAGAWSWEATADGYLTSEGALSVCRGGTLDVALVPDEDVTFVGTVYSGDDASAAGSDGATVLAIGRGARLGVQNETEVGADGAFSIALPAGYYDVHIDHQRASEGSIGDEHLRFDVERTELLADTDMTFRIFSNEDRPDRDISCSTAPSGGAGLGVLMLAGMALVRRRRAC